MVALRWLGAAAAAAPEGAAPEPLLGHFSTHWFFTGSNVALHGDAAAAWGTVARQPVSPALRCVTVLTIFFFTVYLAVVCSRLIRLGAWWLLKKEVKINMFEDKMVEATKVMGLAPMLSVLMISARLRAMELRGGDPERYVQLCMYASTCAFFVRVASDLALGGGGGTALLAAAKEDAGKTDIALRGLQIAYCVATLTLYFAAACILAQGTLAAGAGADRATGWGAGFGPRLSPMLFCAAALTFTYLAECLLLEVLSILSVHLRSPPRLAEEAQDGAGLQQPPAPLLDWAQRHPEPEDGLGQRGGLLPGTQGPVLAELLSLQFPIMFCVLLVGIELRVVQLRLRPDVWAAAAMYTTTASIVVQAVWAIVTATVRTARCWSSAACAPAEDRPLRPSAADAGTWSERLLRSTQTAAFVVVLGGLYVGTAATLVSVFAMEEQPLGVIFPPGGHEEASFSLRDVISGRRRVPPISTAMRCVMLLTVVYFSIYLCLIVSSGVQGRMKRWAESVQGSVQRALAFVPMLCVMMVAVRLRAMQLRVRDPQPWAQCTMYIATLAVITQAACSLCLGSNDGEGFEEYKATMHIAGKVTIITVLVLRYVAAGVLYAAVAALIAALLVMEPAVER